MRWLESGVTASTQRPSETRQTHSLVPPPPRPLVGAVSVAGGGGAGGVQLVAGMNRSAFLRRLAIGTTGLLLGNEALEAFARLTHVRTMFPSAAMYSDGLADITTSTSLHPLTTSTYALWGASYAYSGTVVSGHVYDDLDAVPDVAWFDDPPKRRMTLAPYFQLSEAPHGI